VGNPAIREVDDDVLVVGSRGLFVGELAGVNGHGRLWVQIIESDAPDGKAKLRRRTCCSGDRGGACENAGVCADGFAWLGFILLIRARLSLEVPA